MRKWIITTVSILILMLLLLTACAPKDNNGTNTGNTTGDTTGDTADDTSQDAARKVATFAWTQEPDSLNPFYTDMWFSAILQQLYLCWPWEYDDQNLPYPLLITEMPSVENGGLSADGLVITLSLLDDIKWSDGEPITSADFLFTYEMNMADENAVNSQYPYDYLVDLQAPDDYTVVMTFEEPFAPWESTFWRGILPEHILRPTFEADGNIMEADWNMLPSVGCGPYVAEEWESGSFLRFVANENYWKGAPKIDEIFLQFVPDDAAQTAALLSGGADFGTFPPISDVPALQDAGLTIFTQNGGYAEGWFFNMRDMASEAAKDLVVRQAIAKAIDREAITNDLLLGLAPTAETFWDAIAASGWVASDIEPWTYDPQGARDMLEAAGYVDTDNDGIREGPDGNPLVIYHGTTIREIRQDIQAVTQQYLREVGIDMQIQSWDSDIFFGSYADGAPPAVGDVDIMEWSDGTYFPDPDTDYWLCSQVPDDENPWGYNYFTCDEELDALFQAQLTESNPEARKDIFHQISKIVHDKVYWYGLYVDADYWIVSPNLSGWKISGVTPFSNIAEWDITE
jgi:peptide/nickel transport system substrate-binding protein